MKKIAVAVIAAMILTMSVCAFAAGQGLTAAEAKQAAVKFAGVNMDDASFTKVRLDWDDGRQVYEIEFYVGATEYEMDVDVLTGAVSDFSREYHGYLGNSYGGHYDHDDWDDDWDDLFDWD